MSAPNDCPFCSASLQSTPTRENNGLASGYDCGHCGSFTLAVPLINNLTYDQRLALAGIVRERTDREQDPLLITLDNFEDYVAIAPTRIPDKCRCLLRSLARLTPYFGASVKIPSDPTTRPHQISSVFARRAFAQNDDELRSLLQCLEENQWIRTEGSTAYSKSVRVTARGFELLETREEGRLESGSAFVAMAFRDTLRVFKNGIEPAVKGAGYDAIRIDLEEHNDDIVDRVLAEIRKSRFVVADFTSHRNGVYFEAGYALGMGIPVIWTCGKKDRKKAHFDTEHFNHIFWEDTDELQSRLSLRIDATIGKGPRRIDGELDVTQ